MSPASIERWKKKREGGKARYIILTGILGWGLAMFVVTTFVLNKRPITLSAIFFAFLLWLICGAAFGWLTWVVNEHIYRKATEANGA